LKGRLFSCLGYGGLEKAKKIPSIKKKSPEYLSRFLTGGVGGEKGIGGVCRVLEGGGCDQVRFQKSCRGEGARRWAGVKGGGERSVGGGVSAYLDYIRGTSGEPKNA